MANIRPVQDFGGLGQLAQTILTNRALEQQRVDKERAFGLQEAAGGRADLAAELSRRVSEGQLTAQEDKRALAGQQAATGASLADLVAGIPPADQVGPPIPRDVTLQRAAELTAQPGGGGIERLSEFAGQLDVVRPEDAAQEIAKRVAGQKSTPFIVNVGGEQKVATPIFDANTNTTSISFAPLPEGATITSRLGETPAEAEARKVREASAAEAAKLAERLKTSPEIKRQETIAVLEEKIRLEPDLEKRKVLQKDAAKAAESNIVQLAKTEQNIRNYDNAIKAVQQGASTGTITRMFPSFRTSSILLDQMQAELGLDVVGSVTFGALSKGELDLAKEVALPTDLEGPELIEWIEGKRAVQVKMANILREASIFLSQEGTTRADWLQKNQAAALPIAPSPAAPRVTGEGGIPNLAEQAGQAQGGIKFLGFE